jgi:hypothetical protein
MRWRSSRLTAPSESMSQRVALAATSSGRAASASAVAQACCQEWAALALEGASAAAFAVPPARDRGLRVCGPCAGLAAPSGTPGLPWAEY